MTLTQTLDISNDDTSDMLLIIEPWAEECVIGPGHTASLAIKYEWPGTPLCSIGPNQVVVYLWSSCTCRISIDNQPVLLGMLDNPHP